MQPPCDLLSKDAVLHVTHDCLLSSLSGLDEARSRALCVDSTDVQCSAQSAPAGCITSQDIRTGDDQDRYCTVV